MIQFLILNATSNSKFGMGWRDGRQEAEKPVRGQWFRRALLGNRMEEKGFECDVLEEGVEGQLFLNA